MVRELSARHALPKDIVEGVSERTGGVPLFVEEVTRLLLERGEQGGAQAIPPTLQQSLAARLDRLGAARETAQIGAVLGRGFSYALLQSVAGLDEGALQSALERLAEADILFVEGDGAQANYRFKHALIQDAAYDSLLKSRRQALHAPGCRNPARKRVARTRGDRPSFHPSRPRRSGDRMVGQGGRPGACAARPSRRRSPISARRSPWRTRAGARCSGRQAARRPNRGLTQLHVAYGNALIAARGYGAPETTEAFARARESASATRMRPSDWRPTTACGSAASCGASLPSMQGARGDIPQRRRGETRFARGRRRPSRSRTHALVRRRVSSKRAIIWNARWPCSSPAATTIWPSALDRTRASGRCFTSRLRCGRWAMSNARFRSSASARERIAGLAHIATRAYGNMHCGHVRTDAWRPVARRAERRRTRPTRARA